MKFIYFSATKTKLLGYALLATLAILTTNTQASEAPQWRSWKQSNELSVVYRESQYKGLIEIKAQAKLNSTLAGFIYFIEDLKHIANWLDNAESAEIIQQITATENIFMTRFHGIWPVSPREMLIHSRFWQNKDLSIEIAVTDASNTMEKSKKAIRMKVHSAHWKIVPTSADSIEITYQFIVDPNGNIPQWLTKPMTLNGIWTTLNNMKEQLPISKWQKESRADIQEFN